MADELLTQLMRARPGEAVEYWRGFLAFDRCYDEGREYRARTDPESAAGKVAVLAWDLEQKGMVELVQRRLGDMSYVYLAVKKVPEKRRSAPQSIVADIRRNAGKPRGVTWAR